MGEGRPPGPVDWVLGMRSTSEGDDEGGRGEAVEAGDGSGIFAF